MGSDAVAGILSVFSWQVLLLMVLGTVAGIIVGSIPGLSVTMGVALFLPLTFGMQPIAALALTMALYVGGTSGGLISAILLGIPGTAASVATTFEGYPMARRGEAGKALGIGIVASFLGGLLSYLILMLVAPSIATIALQFGPYEYFSIGVFSLTMIASLASDSLIKGIISAVFGLTASFVGMAPVTGFPRFTFGFSELNGGFSILPVLIGLFAISQIMVFAEEKYRRQTPISNYKIKGFGFTKEDVKGQGSNFLVSSLIGTGIGILPGLGGSICNLIAYSTAKSRSKHPEKFGTGIPDGLIASESSNNASTGGALVPLMTLGIPGDNTTAVILAAFMIHGLTPGPLLFTTQCKLVYGIFAALIIANIMMIIAEYFGMRMFIKILTIPGNILMPIVMAFCVVGAFSSNNRIFDVFVALGFGLLGYAFKKFKIPEAPMILGFILGPMVETYLRRGLMKSQGSFLPFITEPISGVFLLIAALTLARILYKAAKKNGLLQCQKKAT